MALGDLRLRWARGFFLFPRLLRSPRNSGRHRQPGSSRAPEEPLTDQSPGARRPGRERRLCLRPQRRARSARPVPAPARGELPRAPRQPGSLLRLQLGLRPAPPPAPRRLRPEPGPAPGPPLPHLLRRRRGGAGPWAAPGRPPPARSPPLRPPAAPGPPGRADPGPGTRRRVDGPPLIQRLPGSPTWGAGRARLLRGTLHQVRSSPAWPRGCPLPRVLTPDPERRGYVCVRTLGLCPSRCLGEDGGRALGGRQEAGSSPNRPHPGISPAGLQRWLRRVETNCGDVSRASRRTEVRGARSARAAGYGACLALLASFLSCASGLICTADPGKKRTGGGNPWFGSQKKGDWNSHQIYNFRNNSFWWACLPASSGQ